MEDARLVSKGFNCKNCGGCCGLVPISKVEKERIQKFIRRQFVPKVKEIVTQGRDKLDCIFLDKRSNKCFIYPVRPDVCRMQGLYKGLPCPNNLGKDLLEVSDKLEQASSKVGVIGMNIGWEEFCDN